MKPDTIPYPGAAWVLVSIRGKERRRIRIRLKEMRYGNGSGSLRSSWLMPPAFGKPPAHRAAIRYDTDAQNTA